MKIKNTIIGVLLVTLVLVSASFVFYAHAQQKQKRGQAEFYIAVHDAMYRCAEIGNTQAVAKIRSTLGSTLWGEVRQYRIQFGDVKGTNNFSKHFANAKRITDQIQMVPLSSLTNNLGADVTISPN